MGGIRLEKLTMFFTRIMQRYTPDPLTIAVLFTIFTFLLVMIIEGTPFLESVNMWGSGFWDLLAFTMQISLVLMTGYALASTTIVDRFLDKVTSKIQKPSTAIIITTIISCLANLINFGFGLIIGALVGRKIALNVKGVHYPLIIAAGYSGFVLYGLGLSGTIPITIATPGHFLEDQIGVIPLYETVFSLPMIITTLAVIITLPFLNAALHPKKAEDIIEIKRNPSSEVAATIEAFSVKDLTFADRLNNSRILCIAISSIGMIYIIMYFLQGNTLNLNVINFIFLFLGLLFSGSIVRYYELMLDGVKTAVGLIIQYPFYAGIIVLLVGSGLGTSFSQIFISFSTAESLPFWGLISGFFINILDSVCWWSMGASRTYYD